MCQCVCAEGALGQGEVQLAVGGLGGGKQVSLMRGTPLIAPLRQPGAKQRLTALWRSALFSSTRLRSKNLMSGCTCRPFIPVCTGSGSGMQNPLANFIGVFSLVRDVQGFQVNPLCHHDITRSYRPTDREQTTIILMTMTRTVIYITL